MKQKEFIGTIKSGLVGGLALTSFFCVVVILSLSFGIRTLCLLVETILKSAPSILGLFIIIGIVGFIIGLIVGRFFPFLRRGILPLVVTFVVALPFGFVTWVYYKATMQVEYPAQDLKLADCTNNVVRFHLNAPTGHDHQLQLRIPGITVSPAGNCTTSYNFIGRLSVLSNQVLIADMPISSDKSWLVPSGYILTGVGMQNTNVPPLSKLIQSHKDYDFEIKLDPIPPANTSIWIGWWESKIDK